MWCLPTSRTPTAPCCLFSACSSQRHAPVLWYGISHTLDPQIALQDLFALLTSSRAEAKVQLGAVEREVASAPLSTEDESAWLSITSKRDQVKTEPPGVWGCTVWLVLLVHRRTAVSTNDTHTLHTDKTPTLTRAHVHKYTCMPPPPPHAHLCHCLLCCLVLSSFWLCYYHPSLTGTTGLRAPGPGPPCRPGCQERPPPENTESHQRHGGCVRNRGRTKWSRPPATHSNVSQHPPAPSSAPMSALCRPPRLPVYRPPASCLPVVSKLTC